VNKLSYTILLALALQKRQQKLSCALLFFRIETAVFYGVYLSSFFWRIRKNHVCIKKTRPNKVMCETSFIDPSTIANPQMTSSHPYNPMSSVPQKRELSWRRSFPIAIPDAFIAGVNLTGRSKERSKGYRSI
jgi:hypothetical protein